MPNQAIKTLKTMLINLTKVTALTATITTITATTAMALPSDAKKPIKLSADRATYKESTGVTTYSGNVIISQGTLKINADSITLNLSKKRSINTAIAKGHPARMEQVITAAKGKAKGQANSIEYNNITGILTLTGNAKLTQNGASFAGNKIRYSLKEGDVEALGGKKQRVELIFPPNELSNPTSVK